MGNKNSSQKPQSSVPSTQSDCKSEEHDFFDFDPKVIYTRGISRAVVSFWTQQVCGISKPVLYQLNNCIIEKLCNEFPHCKNQMNATTDAITHISALLKLLSQTHCDSTQILQSSVLLNYADLCSKNDIEITDLIPVWKEISPILAEMFFGDCSISRQYCLDVVVLYLISLLEYRNSFDSNQSSVTNSPNSSVCDIFGDSPLPNPNESNNRNRLSLATYSISSTYDSCKTKHLLSDLIALEFAKTTEQCITHTFGCNYVCQFLKGIESMHPELLWFWKDFSLFTTMDTMSDEYIKLAAAMITTFLYENAPNSLVLNKVIQPDTAKTALQLCQKNKFRLAFNVMYIDSLQWCDEKQLTKFRESLTKDLKL